VQDLIFRVETFPPPGGKVRAGEFLRVNGGCAGTAAIAVARLGGAARYVGPLGARGEPVSEDILATLSQEGVDAAHVVRVAGAAAPVSAILVDGAGERMIATRVDPRLDEARLEDADRLLDGVDAVLADNRYDPFVLPVCAAAHARGIAVVLDADRPRRAGDPLFACASHVIYSREALQAMAGTDDLARALPSVATRADAFYAVTDGGRDVLWMDGGVVRRQRVPQVAVVDTLAAGDVFHGAFALAIAEGRDAPAALAFAAATASLKCTRFGGIAGAPRRDEVDTLFGPPAT
jgi:sugar/nucleoside kinase (ribokinase family)